MSKEKGGRITAGQNSGILVNYYMILSRHDSVCSSSDCHALASNHNRATSSSRW
jgi:hypothetical protein